MSSMVESAKTTFPLKKRLHTPLSIPPRLFHSLSSCALRRASLPRSRAAAPATRSTSLRTAAALPRARQPRRHANGSPRGGVREDALDFALLARFLGRGQLVRRCALLQRRCALRVRAVSRERAVQSQTNLLEQRRFAAARRRQAGAGGVHVGDQCLQRFARGRRRPACATQVSGRAGLYSVPGNGLDGGHLATVLAPRAPLQLAHGARHRAAPVAVRPVSSW